MCLCVSAAGPCGSTGRDGDGAQDCRRGSAAPSRPAYAAAAAPRHPAGSGLGGESGLLQAAGSQQGGHDQRDTTGLQEAGSHHAPRQKPCELL